MKNNQTKNIILILVSLIVLALVGFLFFGKEEAIENSMVEIERETEEINTSKEVETKDIVTDQNTKTIKNEDNGLSVYNSILGVTISYPSYENPVISEEGQFHYGKGEVEGFSITSSETGDFRNDFNSGKNAFRAILTVVPIEETTCLYRPLGEFETTARDVYDINLENGSILKTKVVYSTNPSDKDNNGLPTEGFVSSNQVEACVAKDGKFYHINIMSSDLIDSEISQAVDDILKSIKIN